MKVKDESDAMSDDCRASFSKSMDGERMFKFLPWYVTHERWRND